MNEHLENLGRAAGLRWTLTLIGLLALSARPALAQVDAGSSPETSALAADAETDGASSAEDGGTADTPKAAAELDADALPADAAGGSEADARDEAAAATADAPGSAAVGAAPMAGGEAAEVTTAEPAKTEPAAPEPVTVTVRGQLSEREQLQRSSAAVTVVDLRQARKRSSDLGEVMARVAGVALQRYGGLGSEFRFSINGLYDAQIRVFLDAIPLDLLFPNGLANVPINLLQEFAVYRGVVPLRLSADALGGAVNLVTEKTYETKLQGSYQMGSFGTYRATLAARYRHEASGFIAGVNAFFDDADNDYPIDVEVPDERGRLSPARVRRFHDHYRGYGASAEAGVVDKPWARKLLLGAFTSSAAKEIQHNIVMTVPYGEPRYGVQLVGALAKYENTFRDRYDLNVDAVYSHAAIDFVDKGAWVYDWNGERIRERRVRGEIESRPRDQTTWQHNVFARATFDARIRPGHVLTVAASPDYSTRTGDERMQLDPDARDPLTAERELFKLTSGIAYKLSLAPLPGAPPPEERRPEHYRWENELFLKGYVYRTDSEEPLPGNIFRRRDKQRDLAGVGNMLRTVLVDDYLLCKVSYEYSTRLPDAYEVFGNAVLILANLELEPETSHNANLGPQLDLRGSKAGDFWLEVNAFVRDSRDLIVLLGNDRYFTYQNVFRARALGIENFFKWTSPGRYVTLDGMFSYLDQRNVSDQGTFGDFKGDRIPNRPWMFSSWGGYLRFDDVLLKRDRIEPFYLGRFVHEFYRGWESVGLREFKQVVPRQISHTVGVTYTTHVGRGNLHVTFDVQNLADAKLYDRFGVQRPGRGYYLKVVGEL
jgi:vitamin B12 transporter